MVDPQVFIAIGLAAVLSGATGLAFPLIAGPIFLATNEPAQAILLTSITALICNVTGMALLRDTVTYKVRWSIIAPVLIGMPIGTVLVLMIANASILRIGFGLLLVLITSVALLRLRFKIAVPNWPAVQTLVGLVSGVVGGMFAAPIPLIASWLNLRGLPKNDIRAVVQPLAIIGQFIIIAILLHSGQISAGAMQHVVGLVPTLLVGVFIGVQIFKRISHGSYSLALNGIVLATGIVLIVR